MSELIFSITINVRTYIFNNYTARQSIPHVNDTGRIYFYLNDLFPPYRTPQGGQFSSALLPWLPLQPSEPLTLYRLSLTPGMVLQPFRNKVTIQIIISIR